MAGQKIDQKIVVVKPTTTLYVQNMQTAERDYLAMHII
jgi:hypothetical protein